MFCATEGCYFSKHSVSARKEELYMNGTMSRELTPDGVISVYKPPKMTSHDVVGRLRRLYNTKQVGHTGTLDPMATGVLVVMVGRAVKASEYLTAENKSYSAGLKLGLTTDTEDVTGQVLTRFCGELPRFEQVKAACERFLGDSLQLPPMYSALKVDGKKLVDLARRGIEVERQPRKISISKIELEATDAPDEFVMAVDCSKGTYIRTLCSDIGAALGCGAVMSSLERTASGAFKVSDAVTLEQLEQMDMAERISRLCPVEKLFSSFDAVILGDFFSHLAHCGCELYQKKLGTAYPDSTLVRLCDKEGFFALGEAREYPDGSAIKPVKQFKI